MKFAIINSSDAQKSQDEYHRDESQPVHQKAEMEDLVVFVGLESLGTLAVAGNLCLIAVLLRSRYLSRASFILMLSLAIADVLHGLVTTTFFYPPIIMKVLTVPASGIRIYNIIDWTAWSITLTHMSAICIDRLVAIMLYGRYHTLMTTNRIKMFTISCWTFFLLLNIGYIVSGFCCLITPLHSHHFYTFGYGEFEADQEMKSSNFLGSKNVFTFTYTPLEILTICILSVSNPITLIQLYRRHKRKMALKKASTMLLEVSIHMGSKHINPQVHEITCRRANRQQQKILLQISAVAVIFYLYMTIYYLLYHILEISNKWLVLFNSFFYSTTHMINPIIYFSLNKDMRVQLTRSVSECLNWICCVYENGRYPHYSYDGRKSSRRNEIGSAENKPNSGKSGKSSDRSIGFNLNDAIITF